MGLSTNQTQSDDQALLESSSGTVDDQLPKTPPPIRGRQQQQQQSEPLNCPRCISTNTKFCYYNNYNKSQPRHFCKSCKRHWTKGGTLRNVPVGGGRKNKRLKLSSTRSSTTSSNNNGSNAPVVADQNHQDSHILFQSLINRDPINGFGSKNLMKGTTNYSSSDPMLLQPPQNDQNLHLSFSTNLDPFGSVDVGSRVRGPEARLISDNSDLGRGVTIPYPIPSFSQSFNGFDFSGKSDTSTSSIFSQVWQQGPSTSNVVGAEMTNYWNWNDIDTLVSADLNIPWAWDDAEIKP